MNEVIVESKEQRIVLKDNKVAHIKYNPFNKYWYYDMYDSEGNIIAYGMALKPNTFATNKQQVGGLALIDRLPNDKSEYNPFVELGGRLMLVEL